jgi:subtilase family serine protease
VLQAQVDPEFTVNEVDKTNNIMSISYNVDDAGACP